MKQTDCQSPGHRALTSVSEGPALILTTLLMAVGVLWAVQWIRESKPVAKSEPGPGAIVPLKPAPPAVDPDVGMKVYRESIVPLLDQFDRRNQQAADRAVVTLHARIARHRAGVEPFARDVVSWGTRFGVIRRFPSDLMHKVRHEGDSNQVATYVNEKFRRQIISEDQLQQDVSAVLKQFEGDVAANRNRLYAQMSLPLSQIRCSQPLEGQSFESFRDQTQRKAAQLTRVLAGDTVVAGIAEFSMSWAATDVSQAIASRVVAQILTRVGTAMAVEGIEAGGATASAAAVGGGAGTTVGPAGTVIGLGVGIVIGAAVDWWLSDKFEAKVVGQCNQFLSLLDHHLCDGNTTVPGLRQSLAQTVQLAGAGQRQAIERAMQEIK